VNLMARIHSICLDGNPEHSGLSWEHRRLRAEEVLAA
jgi:hypothetical protein